MDNVVLFEKENGVAIITLNRPEKRNALNRAILAGLYDRIDEVASDPDIRVAIITGAGPAFCAGLDLKAIAVENLMDPRGDGRDLVDVLGACPRPLIGAINGPAITGGFELALQCDFLIASETASFTDSHVERGIHPGWGMSQLLQDAVGRRMAKQMSLTCDSLSAREALAMRLVNEVVAPERLLERAREIAGRIARMNPPMVATMRRLIDFRVGSTLHEALVEERRGFMDFFNSAWKK
ncbi:MAG: enoyl-CoA hydratase [Spirochaetes bacterium]|nr:enoyl-CoA hydratase [Spirochaetota bacterium]